MAGAHAGFQAAIRARMLPAGGPRGGALRTVRPSGSARRLVPAQHASTADAKQGANRRMATGGPSGARNGVTGRRRGMARTGGGPSTRICLWIGLAGATTPAPATPTMSGQAGPAGHNAAAIRKMATKAPMRRVGCIARTQPPQRSSGRSITVTSRPLRAGSMRTGGPGRNRTDVRGFAVRCMATLPPGRRRRASRTGNRPARGGET